MVLPSPLPTNSRNFFSRRTFFLRMFGLPVFESQALPLLVHPAQFIVFLNAHLKEPIFPCRLEELVIVLLVFRKRKFFPNGLAQFRRPVPTVAVEQSEVMFYLSFVLVSTIDDY